jgi:hypothetical protein
MISSTSSTSIIGVTLMSDCSAPDAPEVIARALLLLVRVVAEVHHLVRLRDGGHHPDPRAPGRLDRILHLGVLELIVRLEVQDLVLGPGGKDPPELVFQAGVRQRAAVQEILPALVDAQHHFILAFGPRIQVLALRQGRLEPGGDEGRHNHEDDQEHQHDVDHGRHIDVRLDGRRSGATRGYGHCRSPPSGPGIPW